MVLKQNIFESTRSLIGVDGRTRKTLAGRNGSIAPEPHAFSLSYWIYLNSTARLYIPDELNADWSLDSGCLPIVVSEWKAENIDVKVTVFAREDKSNKDEIVNMSGISLTNRGPDTEELTLYGVIQNSGLKKRRDANGVKRVVCGNGGIIEVNDKKSIHFKTKPDTFRSAGLEEILKSAKSGQLPGENNLTDLHGNAAGAGTYRIYLKPGEKKEYEILVFSAGHTARSGEVPENEYDFASSLKDVRKFWQNKVPVEISLPDKRYELCFYSSLYYMLIMMTKNELWCGAYNYEFSLHDAIDMAGALDKAGLTGEVDKTLEDMDFKNNQNSLDGCGGYVFSIYEHYRITQNKSWLKKKYPKMIEACIWLKELRSKQLSPELKDSPLYGLLPESTSQDNFSMKVHLYIDNWWGVAAFKSAVEAAKVLGKKNDIEWLKPEYEDYFSCIITSINKVMKRDNVSYVPAFADYLAPEKRVIDKEHRILGETQMAWAHRPALFPGVSLGFPLPFELFKNSYHNYWKKAGKHSGYDGGWYVEYEKYFWGYNVMLAHPLLFLGMEDIALKSIQWNIEHQSCPGGWMEAMNTRISKNGLVEIDSDGEIVGDCPHGWVAAHYVLMLRNMLIREEGNRLVLLSCVPESWFEDGKVIEIKNAPTYFGRVDFRFESRPSEGYAKVNIYADNPPGGGYLLISHADNTINKVVVNNKKLECVKKNEVNIPAFKKAEVLIYYL